MGAFFSKKKSYRCIDQSYLLDNLDDIKIDVANKKAITAQDFDHAIRLLEDQINNLKNIIKDMDVNYAREIAQLRQTNTAIFADLKKLVDNDAILDHNINDIRQRVCNLE